MTLIQGSRLKKASLAVIGLGSFYVVFGISFLFVPMPSVYKERVETRLSSASMPADWSARASQMLADGTYTLADWYELQVSGKSQNVFLRFVDRTNLGALFYLCPFCVGPLDDVATALNANLVTPER